MLESKSVKKRGEKKSVVFPDILPVFRSTYGVVMVMWSRVFLTWFDLVWLQRVLG